MQQHQMKFNQIYLLKIARKKIKEKHRKWMLLLFVFSRFELSTQTKTTKTTNREKKEKKKGITICGKLFVHIFQK